MTRSAAPSFPVDLALRAVATFSARSAFSRARPRFQRHPDRQAQCRGLLRLLMPFIEGSATVDGDALTAGAPPPPRCQAAAADLRVPPSTSSLRANEQRHVEQFGDGAGDHTTIRVGSGAARAPGRSRFSARQPARAVPMASDPTSASSLTSTPLSAPIARALRSNRSRWPDPCRGRRPRRRASPAGATPLRWCTRRKD